MTKHGRSTKGWVSLWLMSCAIVATGALADSDLERVTEPIETQTLENSGTEPTLAHDSTPVSVQVFQSEVKSINALTNVLKLRDGSGERVFELPAEATITDGGIPLELADLPKESWVSVEYFTHGERLVAKSVVCLAKSTNEKIRPKR